MECDDDYGGGWLFHHQHEKLTGVKCNMETKRYDTERNYANHVQYDDWRTITINRYLVNLVRDLQRIVRFGARMDLHACVRLFLPQEDKEEEGFEVTIRDILVIGGRDDADALPAACRLGLRNDTADIPINHLHRKLIANYANDENIITLLLYHVLPDGALCSPGKDWDAVQHTVYNREWESSDW